MKKLVYINACIRGEESRTGKLAAAMLEVLGERYEITEINICNMDLGCIIANEFNRRKLSGIPAEDLHYGNLITQADRIVVAAPFWDMSFPSVLKVFFEHVSAPDVTFRNQADGSTIGNCKAEKLLYLTTRGMTIPTGAPLDQGTPYIKALCWLWGIGQVETLAVCGTDVKPHDQIEAEITAAIEQGLKICEDF